MLLFLSWCTNQLTFYSFDSFYFFMCTSAIELVFTLLFALTERLTFSRLGAPCLSFFGVFSVCVPSALFCHFQSEAITFMTSSSFFSTLLVLRLAHWTVSTVSVRQCRPYHHPNSFTTFIFSSFERRQGGTGLCWVTKTERKSMLNVEPACCHR